MNAEILTKARKIKLIITDIDGVWTDGKIYYSADGELSKGFSYYDGMAVHLLRQAGIQTAIITGEDSPIVAQRAKKLKIEECHLGIHNKLSVFEEILERHKLSPEDVAYIGDDVNDYAPMQVAGLTAAPVNTPAFSQLKPHILLTRRGGEGAFREFADLILLARNWENALP
ncbi:MAG: HAD family hydrolase [Candidatus Marinimicrobia bacterium]|nr:HAD family hydrolase [Candidatus Neomarinimicrobiota bacterium]MCF7840257.1 HAD family hydrolase [Candidatus Neomarinimicrobiota bacterium]MCF7902622.1 HAD family hydrolase [Candidatus Neomarinimicrobiota bacterium]